MKKHAFIVSVLIATLLIPAPPAPAASIKSWGETVFDSSNFPITNAAAVAAGGRYNLVLKSDGSIVGWGDNYSGQATPPAGNNYIAIAAGGSHSLALKSDGSIVGWGRNDYGQAAPPAGNNFIAISAGGFHSLALKSDGSIVGWGRNDYGQRTPPTGNNFIAISAGWNHSLALKSDGSIVGWGNNYWGQATPPAGNNFIAISAGVFHSLALKSDGSIVGWGSNNDGLGHYCGQATPPAGKNFVAISAGCYHSLALKSDGSIVGWGSNDYGQAKPPAGNNFIAISAGYYHGLALKSDGSIVGWGDNSYGQAAPPTGNNFVAIAAGGEHGLALKSDGSIVGWGNNDYGQAKPPAGNNFIAVAAGEYHSLALKSDGSIIAWGAETTSPAGNNFIAVAAGDGYSLALKSDGSIVGWGYNAYGQATPPAGNNFIAIAAGDEHSLALKSDGSIVAWGLNIYGQATPPAGNNFVAIAAGSWHSLALKSDGSIVGWGYNAYGQAGSRAGNNFIAIAGGTWHSLALKSNGSIVGWGYNSYGQATPPAGNNYVAIAAGGSQSLALRNTAPIANAGPDQTVYADSNLSAVADCSANVTLNGSNSYDPDGDKLTYTWKLNGQVIAASGSSDIINFADFAALAQNWSGNENSFSELALLTSAWLSTPNTPNWNPNCNLAAGSLVGSSTGPITTVNLPLGEHHIQLIVNDGIVDSQPDEVVITVLDNTPPTITLNGLSTIVLECGIDTYTESGASASDNCAGNVSVVIGGDTVNTSNCGTYIITYTAADPSGNSSQITRTVIVQDTTSPTITLNGPSPMVLECGLDTYTEPGATATDNCSGNVPVTVGGDTVNTLSCGTYVITYIATDTSGNSAQITRTVIVQDTTPPEFSLSVTPTTLWPPNHQMVRITPAWIVSDNCDQSLRVLLVSITSNEPDNGVGDGDTANDILIDPNGFISLRAERSGAGTGRIYTITFRAVDDADNSTESSATVTVPHDQSSPQ